MQALKQRLHRFSRRMSPVQQQQQKHEAETAFWRESLQHLRRWFNDGETGRSGIRPPRPDQKLSVSDSWVVNAVMTRHAMCPSYMERLRIEHDRFRGMRVLEVGCGPLAPILQFDDCTRHCIDPLANAYMAAGWPMFEYDAKIVSVGGESLPYADHYFDAVISVNALDHVDDFERVASEMQRVVKPGGSIYFEVEYHEPTVTEPLVLDDARVLRAFSSCELKRVVARSGKELYENMVSRFDLLPFRFEHGDAQFCTWHGGRK